jgi:endonuclease/exonuclease/phosphatase (EEP) superfamily protein YafD
MVSPEQRIKRIITQVCFAGTTAATLIALFSSSYWVAELFSHFRLYYLLIQALLVLTFLHGRRPVALVLTVLLALPNAWYVGPYLSPMAAYRAFVSGDQNSITIVVLNVSYRNHDYAALSDYIQSRSPEVLVLQEFTPRASSELRDIVRVYPYSIEYPQEGPFGIALYSRLPLHDAERLKLSPSESVNLRATIDLGGERISLYAVHLHPPLSVEWASWREMELARLAEYLQEAPEPRIMVGDLNLTPFSPVFGDFLARTGLDDARRAQGFHVTWPTYPLPAWIPIDHCLADAALPITGVHRGPDVGSDHYPLEVTIAVQSLFQEKIL